MIPVARCPDGKCDWAERFRHPDRARREASGHRCRPGRARPPRPGPRRAAKRLAILLNSAANAAAEQPTARAAVDRAWDVLNADGRRARAAFLAWTRSENCPMPPEGLGGLLRSRYSTAGQVTTSLRIAAGRQRG